MGIKCKLGRLSACESRTGRFVVQGVSSQKKESYFVFPSACCKTRRTNIHRPMSAIRLVLHRTPDIESCLGGGVPIASGAGHSKNRRREPYKKNCRRPFRLVFAACCCPTVRLGVGVGLRKRTNHLDAVRRQRATTHSTRCLLVPKSITAGAQFGHRSACSPGQSVVFCPNHCRHQSEELQKWQQQAASKSSSQPGIQ